MIYISLILDNFGEIYENNDCLRFLELFVIIILLFLSMIFIFFLVDNFMLIEVYFYIEMVLDA